MNNEADSRQKNLSINRMYVYFALHFLLAVIGNVGLSSTAPGTFLKGYLWLFC